MNTEEIKKLVGSLMIVGFDGISLSASCKNYLEQWNLGGVILFKRNIESLEQVSELNKEILANSQVTPILSVDHEGGKVFRLPPPFTVFPAMGEIADRGGGEEVFTKIGQAFGRELQTAGFNLDYAPVLDVNSNPQNPIIGKRAFSEDPHQAFSLAWAFYQGLESTGVLGCGKHFPGHGETTQDSHLTLPNVEKPEEELRACEWIPFVQAIQKEIPMLMTAHVRYSALDSDWPATLSEKILTGLLRQELGFKGLIVSDDFFMKGIAEKWGLEEAAERFLRVGGDLVMLCHQEPVQRRVSAHLVHVVEKDSKFRELLYEKSKKVELFRKRLSTKNAPQSLGEYAKGHQGLLSSFS